MTTPAATLLKMLQMALGAVFALGSLPASAQLAWKTHNIQGIVRISVPEHWAVSDLDSRKNVAAYGGALVGEKDAHVAALAVTSKPFPSGAIIRVSIIREADAGTQAEIIAEVKANPVQARQDLEAVANEMINKMRTAFAKAGGRVIGGPKVKLVAIDKKLALMIQYRRISPDQPNDIYLVTQYHVPMGNIKPLITLSHRERDGLLWKGILSEVFKSVEISPR